MLSSTALPQEELGYRSDLQEYLADDLYRRAMPGVLSFLPAAVLYGLNLRDGSAMPAGLGIALGILAFAIAVRSGVLVLMRRPGNSMKASRREWIFATTSALVAVAMAAVVVVAMRSASSEQFTIVAVISIMVMALTVLSMGPSVLAYLAYMLPNLASLIFVAPWVISPRNAPVMQVVLGISTAALAWMVILRQQALCRVALLGLRHRHANDTLSQRNETLECLNHALADTQSQLLQSEKMASVGQLAAGVAHEINNPVGWIRSNLATLRDYMHRLLALLDTYEAFESTLPAESTDALKPVKSAKLAIDLNYIRADAPQLLEESLDGIGRIDKIVQDLKSFSRIDNNDWEVVDVHVGLETSLSMATHELKYRAQIVKQYGIVPDVECLPFQLNQVFLNLLVNAAQAIEESGKITIRTGGDAHNAWIEISDTGQGIPRELRHRIFDPFFTTKPVGVGTGLGLSVSYGIVKKHGGSIEVESELGIGTTFTVRLPARQTRTAHVEDSDGAPAM